MLIDYLILILDAYYLILELELVTRLVQRNRPLGSPQFNFVKQTQKIEYNKHFLGVVHILHNHFWGPRETPPPCNIVIIWAYPPYVIL